MIYGMFFVEDIKTTLHRRHIEAKRKEHVYLIQYIASRQVLKMELLIILDPIVSSQTPRIDNFYLLPSVISSLVKKSWNSL